MKNIFRTAYNRIIGRDTKTQYFNPEDLGIAVPDMSYTPREIIERFTMGTLPNIGMQEMIQDLDEIELARLLEDDTVIELENDRLLMNQQLAEKYQSLSTFINQSNEVIHKNLAGKQTSEPSQRTDASSAEKLNDGE